jgi:hypothetical protein
MPKDEFDPEDPLELVGVEVSGGDPDQVLDGIVQEYLFMGWSPLQILFLFRSPHYGATHQIYKAKGEAYVKERVQRLAKEWDKGWLTGGKGDA